MFKKGKSSQWQITMIFPFNPMKIIQNQHFSWLHWLHGWDFSGKSTIATGVVRCCGSICHAWTGACGSFPWAPGAISIPDVANQETNSEQPTSFFSGQNAINAQNISKCSENQ